MLPKICNGIRLAVKNFIEANKISAKSKGEVCWIPRIPRFLN